MLPLYTGNYLVLKCILISQYYIYNGLVLDAIILITIFTCNCECGMLPPTVGGAYLGTILGGL